MELARVVVDAGAFDSSSTATRWRHDKAMFAPVWELGFLNGHGPRVAESGLGLIPGHAYCAPYEGVKLKAK